MTAWDDRQYLEALDHWSMSRRRFIAGLAAAVGAVGLAACGTSTTPAATEAPATASAATTPPAPTPTAVTWASNVAPSADEMLDMWKGTGEVTVVSSGGTYQDALRKAIFEPFQEFSGIKINEDSGNDTSKVKAMVDSGVVDWDAVHLDPIGAIALRETGGYFLPLDYSLIDVDNIDERYRLKDAIGFVCTAWIIGYRTDVFTEPNVPQGWADFWDQSKFPGKRSLHGDIQPPVEFALIADGVPGAEVYDVLSTPEGMDRAFKSLDKIKPDIPTWWTTGAQSAQLLTDKEVVMLDAWNGRINAAIKTGAPVAAQFGENMQTTDPWGVLKGCKNPENAMKFIGYATSPKPQARASLMMPYGFTNTKAADYIPAEMLASLPTSPENVKKGFPMSPEWWAHNLNKVLEKWTAWKGA